MTLNRQGSYLVGVLLVIAACAMQQVSDFFFKSINKYIYYTYFDRWILKLQLLVMCDIVSHLYLTVNHRVRTHMFTGIRFEESIRQPKTHASSRRGFIQQKWSTMRLQWVRHDFYYAPVLIICDLTCHDYDKLSTNPRRSRTKFKSENDLCSTNYSSSRCQNRFKRAAKYSDSHV